MVLVATEAQGAFLAVPLEGLVGDEALPFPLFLDTGGRRILYRDVHTGFDHGHLARLHGEGVQRLYVRLEDRSRYFQRVEDNLDLVLKNRGLSLEVRAEILHGVAIEVAEAVLQQSPSRTDVQRARKMLGTYSHLVLREPQSFKAVRQVLQARADLVGHALTVSFLSLGLARYVVGAEPTILMRAGMAGLLHDVGRAGIEDGGDDPDHTTRGYQMLLTLGVPEEVSEAALYHHERFDGSGYPRGLTGEEIPVLARLVGMVNTFERVYAMQQPRVSVFDAMRILAQVYRGCFDEQIAVNFVRMFK